MTSREWRRIRVDWDELLDAFEDGCSDHRYYLDRETGAVHFFSAYLDNDDEKEDERILTSEERYVQVPHSGRAVGRDQMTAFVNTLDDGTERRVLSRALRAPGARESFDKAMDVLPSVRTRWRHFSDEATKASIEAWLNDVSVEPL